MGLPVSSVSGPATGPETVRERRAKPPLFGSLRAKLIASHSFVLLLALALVLGLSAAFLQRYERTAETKRLQDLVVPLTLETGLLLRPNQPLTPTQREQVIRLLDYLADEWSARLLVFYPGDIVWYDTAQTFRGQTLPAYTNAIDQVRKEAQRGGTVHVRIAKRDGAKGDDPFHGDQFVVAAGSKRLPRMSPKAVVGISAPPRGQTLLGLYLPRLLIALAASLGVASLAGYILSRRIAAPVDRLTAAADAMAAGKLEQRVPGEGLDELGRLVASFNTMSRQVATTARSQRDLLANIAHELRTPLTSVQGYTQALRDGVIDEPEEQARALATIGGEAERMALLIGELLDLARLESGQARLELQEVEVPPLLDQVAVRFHPEAERQGVRLRTNAADMNGLRVRGDADRLAQILGNLVGNAIRHTPAGGEVEAEAAPIAALGAGPAAGRPGIRLTVRDTGEGIAPERLPKIFDRFQRGDGNGFGLGLAIVRELVAVHGGTIGVESRPGTGTTFTVDLPSAA